MRLVTKLFAAALVIAATPAFAHGYKLGNLEIGHPWTRATPPSATAGGGFLKITNNGDEDDRLVSASSPIAARVELHTMDMSDGVMKMRPLEDGIPVPAGATVELKPGSLHVMFIDLTAPIEEGESVPATLNFEKAGSVDVEMSATAVGAPGPDANGMKMDGHSMEMPENDKAQ
ncbi:copper(I)-binding protein [Rhodopseudomonas julia]|uniref:Copper(I)-binding protein n=1 Tax=Rhodopseudomonas julia TaxID=200617 RepID=A0ABU0C954_9BRAD|nr:copper chaperone PCu(A)C [Rhodopseudomonas julia]MDQ0327056.1 copper(I)-binding protein [Rhodopseudomonas julia]